MTIQELIDKLNTIEDKSMEVYLYQDGGIMSHLTDFDVYNDYIELW